MKSINIFLRKGHESNILKEPVKPIKGTFSVIIY